MNRNPDQELILSRGFFRSLSICWVAFRGHPPWPAQVLDMKEEYKEIQGINQASKYRTKNSNCLVMFFGTGEYGFINPDADLVQWGVGIIRKFYLGEGVKNADKEKFSLAIEEVLAFYRNSDRC